jgi:hypothetical protein
MTSFEIPYAQLSDGTWSVSVNHAEGRHFSSRVAALSYAINEAKTLASRGIAIIISVEGADGQWRAFDDEMKSLANA